MFHRGEGPLFVNGDRMHRIWILLFHGESPLLEWDRRKTLVFKTSVLLLALGLRPEDSGQRSCEFFFPKGFLQHGHVI